MIIDSRLSNAYLLLINSTRATFSKLMTFNLMITLALLFTFLPLLAHAEQKQTVGDYDIHYVAFDSTFLTPSIAKTYDLRRSSYIGVLNISVIDTALQGSPAVAVRLTGTAKNLVNSNISLEFKEIKEGDAIYYLAEIPHRYDETWHFDIEVQQGKQLNTRLKFKHTFYTQQ